MARAAWRFEIAKVQGQARRINDRLKNLVDKLGADSPLVENIISKMDMFFPDNLSYKNGIPQIARPAQLAKTSETRDMLAGLEKDTPKWGDIRKRYESSYEAFKKEESFFGKPPSLTEYIKINMELPEALLYHYSNFQSENSEKAINIMKRTGRRKSYAELSKVISLAR